MSSFPSLPASSGPRNPFLIDPAGQSGGYAVTATPFCTFSDTAATKSFRSFASHLEVAACLQKAVRRNDISEVTSMLHSRKVDVDSTDRYGCTPLHDARSPEMVDLLVSWGANINATNSWRFSPLHTAAVGTRSGATILRLLHHGASISMQDGEGVTPLHLAADKDDTATAGILLDHGADINARDVKGGTPLHFAVESCLPTMTEFLLSRGADTMVKRRMGFTVFDCAIKYVKSIAVCPVLLHHAATRATFLSKLKAYIATTEGAARLDSFLQQFREESWKRRSPAIAMAFGIER